MESEESLMLLFGLQNVKFSVKLEAPETDGGVHTNVSVSSYLLSVRLICFHVTNLNLIFAINLANHVRYVYTDRYNILLTSSVKL